MGFFDDGLCIGGSGIAFGDLILSVVDPAQGLAIQLGHRADGLLHGFAVERDGGGIAAGTAGSDGRILQDLQSPERFEPQAIFSDKMLHLFFHLCHGVHLLKGH